MFSPQSPDELKGAVNDLIGDPSDGDRPTRLRGPIGDWDVSQVTDMTGIFLHEDYFNYDVSNWDVSRVTDMQVMFRHAHIFKQDISKWDVSCVTDM